MDKNIVVLTDIYYPHPMAGGICAHQVAKGLRDLGYNVHIVCLRRKGEKPEEEFEDMHVHRIKMPVVYWLRDLSEAVHNVFLSKIIYSFAIGINRLLKILLIKWYPLMSPLQIKSYVDCVRKLEVSSVVAEYFSIESSLAGYQLKKKYAKKLIMYNVDSLSNCDSAVGLKLDYVRKKGENWERKIFGLADGVIVMRSHAFHYESKNFSKFRDKIYITDIPLMEEVYGNPEGKGKDAGICNWIYTGTLNFEIRSPEYLIKLFHQLDRDIRLHFFSKGNCEEYISNAAKRSGGRIVQHGHVPKDSLESYYADADVLVSIGNAQGTFLPSKTIEYIAHGKPIIHLTYQENDASIPYLEKYGNALIIDAREDCVEKHAAMVNGFLDTLTVHRISPKDVLEKFKENTPEYTAKIIDDILNKGKDE